MVILLLVLYLLQNAEQLIENVWLIFIDNIYIIFHVYLFYVTKAYNELKITVSWRIKKRASPSHLIASFMCTVGGSGIRIWFIIIKLQKSSIKCLIWSLIVQDYVGNFDFRFSAISWNQCFLDTILSDIQWNFPHLKTCWGSKCIWYFFAFFTGRRPSKADW